MILVSWTPLTGLCPLEYSQMQGLLKVLEQFSSTFQGRFNSQVLFKGLAWLSSTFQGLFNFHVLFKGLAWLSSTFQGPFNFEVLFKGSAWLSSTFQGLFNFQALFKVRLIFKYFSLSKGDSPVLFKADSIFKKALHIKVLLKPMWTRSTHQSIGKASIFGLFMQSWITLSLLQSKWSHLILQETRCAHVSMNRPKM